MNSSYFNTLSEAIDGAIVSAAQYRAQLLNPAQVREEMSLEPISYQKQRRFDFELELYRSRRTQKWFHVVITRLDNGHYELVAYVL